jgi:hypothetical protein
MSDQAEPIVLLPCPWCGPTESGNPFHHPQCRSRVEPANYQQEVELFWVDCLTCESRGPLHGSAKAAKLAWNNRKPQNRIQAEAKRLGIKPHGPLEGLLGQ